MLNIRKVTAVGLMRRELISRLHTCGVERAYYVLLWPPLITLPPTFESQLEQKSCSPGPSKQVWHHHAQVSDEKFKSTYLLLLMMMLMQVRIRLSNVKSILVHIIV